MPGWKPKPPIPSKDSDITDLDRSLSPKRWREEAMPTSDDYTPITNLGDLAPAISQIKRGQDRTAGVVNDLDYVIRQELRPRLDEVRDGFIRLETEHRGSEKRLKSVESDVKTLTTRPPQAHDCYHEDDIRGLEEGNLATRADLATIKTVNGSIKESLDKNVERIDGRSKMLTGAAISVGLFFLASVGGFGAVFYTMKADVDHLSNEQTKVRSDVSSLRDVYVKSIDKVQAAAAQVERAAVKVDDNSERPIDAIWCDLSPQERWRQTRIRGAEKVPQRRCP